MLGGGGEDFEVCGVFGVVLVGSIVSRVVGGIVSQACFSINGRALLGNKV